MMKELKSITQNMKQFGKWEPLVRNWCNKHRMAYVLPEFKELFDDIEKQVHQTQQRGKR